MTDHKELANAIRILSIDAIQNAKSGHPGAPMGMSDIAEVLWRYYLNHNPKNPNWFNRDRFVLSNGHASMLIYSLLHLTGYKISIDDLKKFRQFDSKTPGHPEYNCTPGIEVSTGPLGQGLANAVGMAIAEKILSNKFNKNGYNIVDHKTYVFLGDGCLMEGISHEVCSLAGTLQLGKLIVFYDNNKISIDGNIKSWFTDNTSKRFKSYGWNVIENIDGHDFNQINEAIRKSISICNKPSILICNTIIGFGSPNKSNTNLCHGSPLGEEEILKVKKKLNWNYKKFEIPNHIYKEWNAISNGVKKELEWNKLILNYEKKYNKLFIEFNRRINNILPENWNLIVDNFIKKNKINKLYLSGREASKYILETYAPILPELIGGSADLSISNLTKWSGSTELSKNKNKYKNINYINYGVREFGMTAISNGLSLHGGFIPYTSTFLMFMEYAKNAIRMASLMKIRNIFIYTHDSIGVGEDGPTHQPIEQLTMLRTTPNLSVWRPCDLIETAIAWKYAIECKNNSTAIILSRQDLIQQYRTEKQLLNINKGGYILKSNSDYPEIILISTGSEIGITVKAYFELIKKKYKVNVVSMPCVDIFEKQNKIYKDKILPKNIKSKIVIEAGLKNFWYKYIGDKGKIIGIECFGKSAPSDILFKKFGFTVENIVNVACNMIN